MKTQSSLRESEKLRAVLAHLYRAANKIEKVLKAVERERPVDERFGIPRARTKVKVTKQRQPAF